MVEVNELKNRVNALNAKAQQLNDTRQRKLGAVETAKQRFNELLAEYKAAYGIDITDVNAEYSRVVAETENAVNALAKQIEYIESGAYKADLPKETAENKTVATVQGTTANVSTPITTVPVGNVGVTPVGNVGTVPMGNVGVMPVAPKSAAVSTPVSATPTPAPAPVAPAPAPAPVAPTSIEQTQNVGMPAMANVAESVGSNMFSGVVAPAKGFDIFDGTSVGGTDVEDVSNEDEVVGAAFTPLGWGNSAVGTGETPATSVTPTTAEPMATVNMFTAPPINMPSVSMGGVTPAPVPVAPIAPVAPQAVEKKSAVQPVGMVDLSGVQAANPAQTAIENEFGSLFNSQPFNLGG